MHQDDRNKVINEFKKSTEMNILVATDVAARGLDIPAIKTVVNYDGTKRLFYFKSYLRIGVVRALASKKCYSLIC